MDFLYRFIVLRFVVVEEVDEEGLFLFEVGFYQIEHEGEWYEAKNIDFVGLAILVQIVEQVLLIRQLMVVLKMVQTMPENAIINAGLISIALVGLLPSQVDK